MANVAVVGTQWGDEGKGKVVDYLSAKADLVVRFQKREQRRSTLVVRGGEDDLSSYPFRHPSQRQKVFYRQRWCSILRFLLEEMEDLRKKGVDVSPGCLALSEKTHIIMPYHRAVDIAREASKGKDKIGPRAAV